ncbi:hypothetical protein [Halomicrobium urmianum]|uniref:hypothetical protein n=1 Tax=Halomicrobium urmianum TaxID=1586233 RepID=UPI001CD9F2D5|nr:hypothetical protein [Halomicrobium urmianum]
MSLFSSSKGFCGLDDGDPADNLEQASSVNVSLVYRERACRDASSSDIVPADSSDCGDESGDATLDRNVRACYEADAGRIVREGSCSSTDVLLLGGPQPGSSQDTSIARRGVQLDGKRLILEVRTW